MHKACVIGNFAEEKSFIGGQTIKTKILFNELVNKYGRTCIMKVDTCNWKYKSLKLLIDCVKNIKNSENIIILPADNGIRIFAPLFYIVNSLYHRKLHYVVIGGWLPDMISKNKILKITMKIFSGIYVETYSMKKILNSLDLLNVYYLPNFKRLDIIEYSSILVNKPYRLCTFSRVMEEKGIEDAINAIKFINIKYGKNIFLLDIYGPIDINYRDKFIEIQKQLPSYIKYKGKVLFNKSTEVIKNYLFLLFPTKYEGEGFAGTIIDGFSAGVPVIATDWKYNSEIIDNGNNGILYSAYNNDELILILENIISGKYDIEEMKINCILSAKKFLPDTILSCLYNNM